MMNKWRVAWQLSAGSFPGDGTGREVMGEALRVLSVFEENSPLSFEIKEIPCGGQYYLETGEEWPAGSWGWQGRIRCYSLSGCWPDARLPNGDMAGGRLSSAFALVWNFTRMSDQLDCIQEYVHGIHKQVWDPDLVDIIMIRENTEGLYHSLLRRMGRGHWARKMSDSDRGVPRS